MILNKSSTPIIPRTGQFLAMSAKGLIVVMAHVMRSRTRGGVIKGVSSGRLVQGRLEACKLKGTLASCRSPFGVSESVSSQCLEKELETSKSLNPLVPHSFPCNVKYGIDYRELECDRSDFSSFNKGDSSPVYLSSRDLRHGALPKWDLIL